jgi:Dcp1-like decapping family
MATTSCLNLSVLQRLDPLIEEILALAPHAFLHEIDPQTALWVCFLCSLLCLVNRLIHNTRVYKTWSGNTNSRRIVFWSASVPALVSLTKYVVRSIIYISSVASLQFLYFLVSVEINIYKIYHMKFFSFCFCSFVPQSSQKFILYSKNWLKQKKNIAFNWKL